MKAYNNTKLIETLSHLNISLVQRRPNVFDAEAMFYVCWVGPILVSTVMTDCFTGHRRVIVTVSDTE